MIELSNHIIHNGLYEDYTKLDELHSIMVMINNFKYVLSCLITY
jgi:hypothetical protein